MKRKPKVESVMSGHNLLTNLHHIQPSTTRLDRPRRELTRIHSRRGHQTISNNHVGLVHEDEHWSNPDSPIW